jgi:hypothetical protein
MAANYRHIGGPENSHGRHYSLFDPRCPLLFNHLTPRNRRSVGRIGEVRLAHFDADVTLAVATETDLGLSGKAPIAPLLPAQFMPLIGDWIALSLHATLGDRIIVDPLSIGFAVGARSR